MKVLSWLVTIISISSGMLFGQNNKNITMELNPESVKKLDQLNSPYRETNPCITPDGKYLFFMSGRGEQSWSNPEYTVYHGKNEADGDIYYSKKTGDKWSDPVCMDSTVNTGMGEDEPNVTPDGQFVLFQSWKEGWDTEGGPYYISELSGKRWGIPRPLAGNIHRFFIDQIKKNDWYFATDGSSLSSDGSIFIFAAGKWYQDPMDLYISFRKNGDWTYPVKMDLNTENDERSVFIAGDSRTLFFSSSGYGGYGGLDIFKTVLDDKGHHTAIINLGPVFNTGKDDYGFTMNVAGTEILYTRNADIIQVLLNDPDKLLKPLPTLVINGYVMDYSGNPLEAYIRVINKQTHEVAAKAKSNALTGEYSVAVQKTYNRYIKEINSPGYISKSEDLMIDDYSNSSSVVLKDYMKRENSELIFFDLDQYKIRDSETEKLDSITNYLFQHKHSNILLTGHADQSGTDQYNLQLSKKRVDQVKHYFEEKGIPSRVMRTRYYGERHPLKVFPEGQQAQINRRVEVLIIPIK